MPSPKLALKDIHIGIRLGLTALLAFAIAEALSIPNPYWAAMPVWAMSQPTRGLLLERGVHRLLGTVVGAAFGLALLGATMPTWATVGAFAVWMATMTTLIPLMRGVHAYTPLLAAMTAAIVVVPAIAHPFDVLQLAYARVACTLIGFLVSMAVGYLLTPRASTELLSLQISKIADRAVTHASALLMGLTDSDEEEQRLLHELAELQLAAGAAGAGSAAGYKQLHRVEEMAIAVCRLLSEVHSLTRDRLTCPTQSLETSAALNDAVRGFFITGDGAAQAMLQALVPALEPHLSALREAVGEAKTPLATNCKGGNVNALLAPYRDLGTALEGGVVAGLVCVAALAAVAALHVPHLDAAALGLCIVVTMLVSHPESLRISRSVLVGALAGIIVAILYRWLVLPHVHTSIELVMSLAPFLLLGGLARADARIGAMAFDANQLFLFAGQASLGTAPFGKEVLQGAIALAAGIALPCLIFMHVQRSLQRRHVRTARHVGSAIRNHLTSQRHGLSVQPRFPHRHLFAFGHARPANHAKAGGQSAIAAFSLALSIERLYSQPSDELARFALKELAHMHVDPLATATRLEEGRLQHPAAKCANVVRDAAASLRGCYGFLRAR